MGAPDDFQAVTGLVRRGHRVVHLVPADDHAKSQQAIEGVEVVAYVHPRMPIIRGSRLRHFLYLNYCILRAARPLMRRTRFDVVVGHAALLAPAVSTIGYLTRVPSVLNIYGTFLYPHLGSPRRFLSPEYWGWRVPVTRRIILNDGTRGDKVAKRLGLPADGYVFWANGIDKASIQAVNSFDPSALRRKWGIDPRHRIILTACRLVRWKRVDRVISAAPQVVQACPDALFVLAGDGPERTTLEQQALASGAQNHIRFVGAIPRDDVLGLMKLADVFASVNDLSNVGNPLLEAMGIGKAIVAVDVGATGEVISDRHNGILVPPDRPGELASAMSEILSDPDLRRRLEANAKAYADTQLLTWVERSDNVVELVEGLARK